MGNNILYGLIIESKKKKKKNLCQLVPLSDHG